MKKVIKVILIIIVLLFVYSFPHFNLGISSQTFLIIATFIFTIFTGFFISRQGQRYSSIRDQVSQFDGELTAIYRQLGHIGVNYQKEVAKIIKKHHSLILKNKAWDYHFSHKSTTITDIHKLVEKATKNKALLSLKTLALQRILFSLRDLQNLRKRMVALHNERIPKPQWVLVYFLAAILLLTVLSIPSQFNMLASILKTSFIIAVFFVIFLLKRFDNLHFFEATIGEKSAEDIINILEGKK